MLDFSSGSIVASKLIYSFFSYFHFRDGAGRSGIYCAMCNIFDQMELEGEVDVYNSVKAIKLRRPQSIDTLVMI